MVKVILCFMLCLIFCRPMASIFKKTWVNSIYAFIPFKNIITYLWIIGIKWKYFIASILMILLFFFCQWYSVLLPEHSWFIQFLWMWICSLLSFPTLLFLPLLFLIINDLVNADLLSCWRVFWDKCFENNVDMLNYSELIDIAFIDVLLLPLILIFYCYFFRKLLLRLWWKPWTDLSSLFKWIYVDDYTIFCYLVFDLIYKSWWIKNNETWESEVLVIDDLEINLNSDNKSLGKEKFKDIILKCLKIILMSLWLFFWSAILLWIFEALFWF